MDQGVGKVFHIGLQVVKAQDQRIGAVQFYDGRGQLESLLEELHRAHRRAVGAVLHDQFVGGDRLRGPGMVIAGEGRHDQERPGHQGRSRGRCMEAPSAA